MEIPTNTEVNKYRTLSDDPQYFGGYLNIARHNVSLIINQITDAFSYLNFKKINDDEDIKKGTHILVNIFNPARPEFEDERQKVYNYLLKRHHLPFVKIFNSEVSNENDDNYIDFARLHNFIIKSFRSLDGLRNAFSHHLAIDDDGNKTKRKSEVDDSIVDDIELLFKNAPMFSYIRNFQTQKEEDYEHLKKYKLFTAENQLSDQGLYFFVNLFLERSQATKFLKRFKGFKNETTPPFRATIQAFTSYCVKVPDVRLGNENPKHTLLMEMLTELNKCPKELFYHLTDEDKKEFEPRLQEKEKQNVVLNSTNYEDISNEDLDETVKELTAFKRNEDRFPYFALRFLDETNALKNIRFQITLGKLIVERYDKKITDKFQDRRVLKIVKAYGKLSDFTDKESDVLNILKKGFEDNETIQFEQYAPHYNMSNNKIAFYVFDEADEKIKYPNVFENKAARTDLQNNPTGFISIHDLPKLMVLESLIANKGEQMIVDFIRNTNLEIFDKAGLDQIRQQANFNPETFTKRIANEKALKGRDGDIEYLSVDLENEFLQWLRMSKEQLLSLDKAAFLKKTKDPKSIELFTQIKYQYFLQQRREELQRHLPKDLSINMLPSRILDYLMNIQGQPEDKEIHRKIKAIKDETKKLVKSLEKEIEKPKPEQRLKLGELATYVARDIIDMAIDKDVKTKITSPYYSKLQNKIAYFSLNKEEIIALCDELHLFNKQVGHVFLTKNLIYKANGIIDFYLDYLKAKVDWIDKELLVKIKKGDFRKVPLSIEKIKKDASANDFDVWLLNKSQKPVDLPVTLFDVQLAQILKGKLRQLNVEYNPTDKFSVLLAKYLGNDTQPFYHYNRKYNKSKDNPAEFSVTGLSSKELKTGFSKFMNSNEKLIRFTQTKDRVMKLMCDKLLAEDKSIGLNDRFLLQEIHPDSEHNPLESRASFEQKIYRKGNEAFFTVVAKDNPHQVAEIETFGLLQTEEERQNYKGQKWYQWTIKDFGRFKRFVSDRRIPNLADYFDTQEISFDLLEYQIKEYDKYREKVFELTFKLERAIAKIDFDGIKTIEFSKYQRPKGFSEVQFDVYLDWLTKEEISFDEKLLSECRNKFSHSQVPVVDSGPKITRLQITDFENNKHIKDYKNNADVSVAAKIYNCYYLEVSRLITEVEQLTNKKSLK